MPSVESTLPQSPASLASPWASNKTEAASLRSSEPSRNEEANFIAPKMETLDKTVSKLGEVDGHVRFLCDLTCFKQLRMT